MAFQFPDPNVTTEFTGDNGITYSWDAVDGKWVIKRYAADFDDRYVNEEGGDTMEGQLVINGPRKAGDDPDNPDLVSSVKVLSIDNAQNSSLQLRHSGNAKIYIGDTDVSIASDIKFNRATGSIVKTNDADVLSIAGEEVSYTGKIENDENLVTKKYVDDADEGLRQDIIELEEEINAIAPSIEYGTWKYEEPNDGNIGRPPQPGTFYLISNSAITNEYIQTTAIKIHNDEYVAPGDQDPVDNHTWADANVGDLIQLFDAADPDFFLGRITAKNVDDIGEFVTLTVQRLQSAGTPDDNPDPVTGEFLTRINIFEEPTGGDATEFVKKRGDTMTGDLIINRSTESDDIAAGLKLKGDRPNKTDSAATITFENAQSSQIGYLTYRAFQTEDPWFKFNQDVDLGNKGLHSVDHIRMKPGGSIGSGTNSRILVRAGSSSAAATQIQRPGDGIRTFSIRGKVKGSSTVQDIFWAYGNNGTTGDAINYTGLTTNDNHIATKKYVDSKMPQYTITKSNGNYYVQ